MSTHLWEMEHPYYCEASNYYSNEAHIRYDCWTDFISDFGDMDLDLNHVFRWDWDNNEADEDGPATSRLFLAMMLQRKGKYVPIEIYGMTIDDESQVRKYLERNWQTVMANWAPIG